MALGGLMRCAGSMFRCSDERPHRERTTRNASDNLRFVVNFHAPPPRTRASSIRSAACSSAVSAQFERRILSMQHVGASVTSRHHNLLPVRTQETGNLLVRVHTPFDRSRGAPRRRQPDSIAFDLGPRPTLGVLV